MGTRGLIVVKHKGVTPVAQYCQYDMYPSYHGVKILNFLKRLNQHGIVGKFKTHLNLIVDVTGVIESMQRNCHPFEIEWYYKQRPQLARNYSSKVLDYILNNSEREIELVNNIEFASDTLECEWCYVIDFDKNTFVISNCFGRVKTYPLYGLPKTKRFCEELDY